MADLSDRPDRVLDRPVWHALAGRQRPLALGDDRARRFPGEYGPFGAAADDADDALAALADLSGDGELWLVERAPAPAPPGMAIVRQAECVQMVAKAVTPVTTGQRYEDLDDADAAEMLALATLTVPGPFSSKTNRLGRFIGIRMDGRLVAMAGERMKPGFYTEVSGVCTHPDWRGRGHAAALMRVVAGRIVDRGEIPFLHCYASNVRAIDLYGTLGFEIHQSITASILKRE